MMVDEQFVIDSIRGDKYYHFLTTFPNLRAEIDKVRDGGENHDSLHFLSRLKSVNNYKAKLKKILGREVTFDKQIEKPTPDRLKRNITVFHIDANEYDDWFVDFFKKNKNISMYNVCYNSKEDKYVVSTIYIERNR